MAEQAHGAGKKGWFLHGKMLRNHSEQNPLVDPCAGFIAFTELWQHLHNLIAGAANG